jgi:chromosome segregation ATPase
MQQKHIFILLIMSVIGIIIYFITTRDKKRVTELETIIKEKEKEIVKIEAKTIETIKILKANNDAEIAAIKAEMNKKIAEINAAKEAAMAALRAKADAEIAAMAANNQAERTRLETEYTAMVQKLKDDRTAVVTELTKLKIKYDNDLAAAAAAKADALALQKGDYDARLGDLNSQLQTAKEKIARMEQTVMYQIGMITDLEGQLAQKNAEITDLNTRLQQKIDALATMTSDMAAAAAAAEKKYNDMLAQKTAEINTLRTTTEEQIRQINSDHAAEILRLTNKHAQDITDLKAEYDAKIKTLKDSAAAAALDYEATIAQNRSEITSLNKQLEQKNTAISDLTIERDALKTELADLKSSSAAEKATLEATIVELNTTIANMERNRLALVDAILEVQAENDTLRAQLAAKNKEIDDLKYDMLVEKDNYQTSIDSIRNSSLSAISAIQTEGEKMITAVKDACTQSKSDALALSAAQCQSSIASQQAQCNADADGLRTLVETCNADLSKLSTLPSFIKDFGSRIKEKSGNDGSVSCQTYCDNNGGATNYGQRYKSAVYQYSYTRKQFDDPSKSAASFGDTVAAGNVSCGCAEPYGSPEGGGGGLNVNPTPRPTPTTTPSRLRALDGPSVTNLQAKLPFSFPTSGSLPNLTPEQYDSMTLADGVGISLEELDALDFTLTNINDPNWLLPLIGKVVTASGSSAAWFFVEPPGLG